MAFVRRARHLAVRPETAADGDFLARLFAHCSPLAAFVPAALLAQQAAIQQTSYATQHPRAMRRIISLDARPIGRIMIDWQPAYSHGIDIAVLPDCRAGGAGLHMLRAWLDVADRCRMMCRLEVERTNSAALLYTRLGFTAVDSDVVPIMTMERAIPATATTQ